MGVSQSTVAKLEQSEASGTVQLESLQRAAAALDCDVAYYLVPRRSLAEMVQDRARHQASKRLAPVAHHSRLEDQTVSDADLEDQLDELAARLVDHRGLWTDDPE